jgi:hypothetical protein
MNDCQMMGVVCFCGDKKNKNLKSLLNLSYKILSCCVCVCVCVCGSIIRMSTSSPELNRSSKRSVLLTRFASHLLLLQPIPSLDQAFPMQEFSFVAETRMQKIQSN